ncbi:MULTISPECIES: ParB/RepB/Spo0J family partition protein [unclassified Imperialibacter]|uniref:ParB/RepB/Spo0J family partition protein n=1 Tax=unclassified Imperialibacter TaxID=2629706 RepID=UPI00125C7029|nr:MULTISPECIES: ParB/RepB/Spo0J family partition protein [unclassified Imperialibacter]CAD5283373.1 ParB family chromosome partitioning protein [Imperialibacter sp. 89]CAD5286179.1 ParB family chromosome partitioning protein [Imperialibacter sp. 75]VVT29776.1 Chromosome partitioning protein ParB [Imperialibacter sp. EC-SDR9]
MTDNKLPKRRNALGRGLGALLDDNTNTSEKLSGSGAGTANAIGEIPVTQIEVNPFQPRTEFNKEALAELSESIKVQGIIQPITVRQLSKNQFQLISGERRLQASKLAGLESIPAYIRTADDQQMLEMALIENIQRENLNSIEIALSYQRLISECNLKQEELGDRVGKNRTTVTNYLRLLKLPPDIQIALRDGRLSMGHARAIIGIDNPATQLSIFKKIISEDLSVRKVESLVREYTQKAPESPSLNKTANPSLSPEVKNLQNKLSSHFGTRISLKADEKNKGEIRIPFVSTEDLNRILEILNI